MKSGDGGGAAGGGRAEATRERLLEAAARLFALQGIAHAQTRDITVLAGQRNASALHYHFGSREGLLRALLLRLGEPVARASLALLDPAGLGKRPSLTHVVRGLVEPLGACLATEEGRHYLLILEQCLANGTALVPQGEGVLAEADVALEERLVLVLPWLPEGVLRRRLRFARQALVGALAAHARLKLSGGAIEVGDESFLEDLVEMLAGAIGAPVPLGAG